MESNIETKKPSLLGLIVNPVKQFNRMKERPTVWLPMFSVMLLLGATTYLTFSPSSKDKVSIYFELMVLLSGILYYGLIIFISALIFWLITSIGGRKTKFVSMFSLSIFVTFIIIIESALVSLISHFTDLHVSITSSQSVFSVKEPYRSMIGAFDIFIIWSLVLLAIGLQKVGGVTKRTAWISVAILFLLFFLVHFIGGLFIALLHF
ncbi:YIP1 family protein [Bacillus sp. CLL-7-23]|uniref:YIP1 family protein n=1 Tax=Bacillus changyiensis TaxID=3004103 RepID=A0ABT4X343_9BACI|nr:YIP1 family protein [Bacillus changyiensis]MDA7026605.1 YIP1 family protein [Bacillus changyiensis]